MKPVTDEFKVSRAKLAYIIDATAAPVCIIAPVSSWAAAVSSFAGEGEGIDRTAGDAKYIGEEFYGIPQPCTASLEVTYDIRYDNANWVPQTEVIDNLETFWEPSKHYTYTVNLRMDKLTHTTGISSWNNQ
jgi:hypothetical protein